MNEPANHTAVVDRFGDTWVRCDDMPGRDGNWWFITDGPGWEEWARVGGQRIAQAGTWDQVEERGPFTLADRDRTLRAIDWVRRERAR